jgi:hypothetical protein
MAMDANSFQMKRSNDKKWRDHLGCITTLRSGAASGHGCAVKPGNLA